MIESPGACNVTEYVLISVASFLIVGLVTSVADPDVCGASIVLMLVLPSNTILQFVAYTIPLPL